MATGCRPTSGPTSVDVVNLFRTEAMLGYLRGNTGFKSRFKDVCLSTRGRSVAGSLFQRLSTEIKCNGDQT